MQTAQTTHYGNMAVIISVIERNLEDLSVAEMPDPRKYHRDAQPICSLNDLGIPDRPSGLNYSGGACLRYNFQTVSKREKGVGSGNGTIKWKNSLHCSESGCIHPTHLTGPNTDRLSVSVAESGVDDGIRFDMFADPPGKDHGTQFLRGRLSFGDNLELSFADA